MIHTSFRHKSTLCGTDAIQSPQCRYCRSASDTSFSSKQHIWVSIGDLVHDVRDPDERALGFARTIQNNVPWTNSPDPPSWKMHPFPGVSRRSLLHLERNIFVLELLKDPDALSRYLSDCARNPLPAVIHSILQIYRAFERARILKDILRSHRSGMICKCFVFPMTQCISIMLNNLMTLYFRAQIVFDRLSNDFRFGMRMFQYVSRDVCPYIFRVIVSFQRVIWYTRARRETD